MTTLTEFLLARVAEEEEAARLVNLGRWYPWDDRNGEMEAALRDLSTSAAAHIRRHSPERVLAECEAKHRIMELHVAQEYLTHLGERWCAVCADWPYTHFDGPPPVAWPCETLRLLALPYAGHPDYRDEWRP